MDKYKGQGQTRSRSLKYRKKPIENPVLLHVYRHACRYFRRKVTKVTMITKRYMYGTSSKFHWFVINKSRVIEVHW